MMRLSMFLVLLNQICHVSGLTQDVGLKIATVGENVTLHCFTEDAAVNYLSWYQQRLGGKPVIIATRMKLHTESTLYPEFKDRFQVVAQIQEGINHLIIKDVRLTDSATYYCGTLEFNEIEFGNGVFLHVKNSSTDQETVIRQSSLEPVSLGDSVNLSCIAYAKPCAGQQHFYWLRHGAAQPVIINHGEGVCLSDPESNLRNCSINLTLQSVSSSDAGMYYCALAACGEIVIGSGSRVEINAASVLVHCLSVALAVSIIALLVLGFIAYRMKKKSCSVCQGTSCSASELVGQNAEDLHYAALSLNRSSKQHHQEESVEGVCVYSRVKSTRE